MNTPEFLDAGRLTSRLVDNGPFAALNVVDVTGSTNTDLANAAHQDAADRTVLFAEEQNAGRGRMRRGWISPRGYGLHISVLLRPTEVDRSALSWVPLIAGVALAETVRTSTGLDAALKWPNDLLLRQGDGWYKAAGLLVDGVLTGSDMAVVVGIGLNVAHGPEQLPNGAGLPATSLALAGASVDRERFAGDLLLALAEVDAVWREHGGDVLGAGLLDRYQRLCGTLGRQVRVELAADADLDGTATEVDSDGRLLVQGSDGVVTPVSAGDIVHLRPA